MSKGITNLEFYKDKLLEFGDELAIHHGKVCRCKDASCEGCIGCDTGDVIKWLLEPYQDPTHVLTIEERQFCELVEEGYIARDEDGELWCYKEKPHKERCTWYSGTEIIEIEELINYGINLEFKFIKWEDEEPWSIEELLKLKVVE